MSKLMLVKESPVCERKGCFKNADFCIEILHKQYFCQEHTDSAISMFAGLVEDKPAIRLYKLVTSIKYASLPTLEEVLNRPFLVTCRLGGVIYAKKIKGRFSKDSLTTVRGSYIDNLSEEWEQVGEVRHLIILLDLAGNSITRLLEALNSGTE